MWVRQSALRPVPSYARLSEHAISRVREQLLEENAHSEAALDEAFDGFEDAQKPLADHVGEVLGGSLSDTLLAVGYFLSLTIWLTFQRSIGSELQTISQDELHSTMELFALDEELRQGRPHDPLDTDDVVAMEQPALVQLVHEHIKKVLDQEGSEVNAEHVRKIYRMLLIEILSLSYAVRAPAGFPLDQKEALA